MKILLVEDDTGFAEVLTAELIDLDHDVSHRETGRAALAALNQDRFDAVVLDCMLPGMAGAEVVRWLRERGQTMPVLMLSALGRSDEKVEGLLAGADDYVVKPTPAFEINARLQALVRARGWVNGEADTLRAGAVVVSPGQHRAWHDDRAMDLTKLEFKLLVELARHADTFLTRAMLLERVWGYDFEPATNIVEGQMRSLRRKLAQAGGDDLIVTKRGVGYMLRA